MNRGYKDFILFLSILWIVTVALDIAYMILLYRPYFGDLSRVPFPVFIIIPLPVLLFYLPGYFTAMWFGFLIIVFSVFFLVAITTGIIKFENSALFKISEFYALNLFLSVVYFLFVDAIGKPVTVPISNNTPFYLNMLSLTNAGLYEELITRVLSIGIPLYLYNRMKKPDWRENGKEVKWYRMVWGGGYKFGKPEITVLIISSLIFGIAHTASWDWSKMPQAFMGGLFLGFLYLRYGLYADVLWHFSIDATSAFLPEGLGNPYANGISNGIATFVDLIFILAGAVIVIYYLVYLVKKGKSKDRIVQSNMNTLICPRCGSIDVSLIYDDIYRCNRCGNVFKRMR
jgi:hypothetical protein